MATIPIPPDFVEFLQLLNEHNIRYLLIGGYAVSYHGYVRATGDIDIWVEPKIENARKMVEVLKAFGFNSSELTETIFTDPKKIVRLGNPPVRIEIMNSISGVEFEECYTEKVEDDWNNTKVDIISLSKLKKNKKESGRFKDLNDLEHLQ